MSRKTGVHRDQLTREQDRARAAALYMRGASYQEISAAIGVSRYTVISDLHTIRRRWLESQIRDFDEARAVELAKIDHLEAAAWDAWDRSCGKQRRRKRETEPSGLDSGADGAPAEIVTKTTVEVRQGWGDARFLERIGWCINRRCALLGLDAPTKIAPTTPDGQSPYQAEKLDGYTLDELREMLAVRDRVRAAQLARLDAERQRRANSIAVESRPALPSPADSTAAVDSD